MLLAKHKRYKDKSRKTDRKDTGTVITQGKKKVKCNTIKVNINELLQLNDNKAKRLKSAKNC